MPAFIYEILDSTGARRSGSLDAVSETAAATALRQDGQRILALRGAESAGTANAGSLLQRRLMRLRPPRTGDLMQALGHLSMMLRAGLSLTQALHLITPETTSLPLREALENITQRVEAGIPFSQALAEHPRLFRSVVTTILASAEESGEMADGLDRVCHHLRFWSDLRRKLLQSLTYPAIVVLLAVGVTVLLVTVFIPKVEKFVNKGGRSLPAITQFLFDLSAFFSRSWPTLLLLVIVLGVLIFFALRRPAIRLAVERVILRLPLFGTAWRSAVFARACGLLTVLLKSGTSLVRALEVSAQAVGSLHYQAVLNETTERVMRGLSLRQSLAQPGIPGSFLGVISAGEESGNLPRAFDQLEQHYAERLSGVMLFMVTLIEPALILMVGGIVAVVYLALFSAVLSLTQ